MRYTKLKNNLTQLKRDKGTILADRATSNSKVKQSNMLGYFLLTNILVLNVLRYSLSIHHFWTRYLLPFEPLYFLLKPIRVFFFGLKLLFEKFYLHWSYILNLSHFIFERSELLTIFFLFLLTFSNIFR